MSIGPSQFPSQPFFEGDAAVVPPLVINGRAVEAAVSGYSDEIGEQGVFVRTAGGQDVPHDIIAEPGDPLSLAGPDIEIELPVLAEETFFLVEQAAALALAGQLQVWLDRPVTDLWIAPGSKATFGLSRSTGYGSTGVTWAQRPARCFVGAVEQTMVTGTPGAAECQLSQTADSTSIVLGTAPAAGVIVTLRYYPVRLCSAGIGFEMPDFNDGSQVLSLVERIPWRVYA